jgi:putative ABC transport system permease protein
MTFIELVHLFVFRHIRREKFLTFLSISGIALGIGLFVGVKAATDRALVSFEENIRGINPHVTDEITDNSGIDFDERIYKDVRDIEGNSFPVLLTSGYISDKNVAIDITGMYTVRVISFLGTPGGERYDIEGFFSSPNGVLITRTFAERYGFRRGDVFRVNAYNGEYALSIVDILDSGTLPSNSVLMDIGNFQDYFGKSGYLSKIDVSSTGEKAALIRRILPPNLSMEDKSHVVRQQQSMIDSFRYNLHFITFLAILVGVFLLYNTIFISVVKRRTEIGILRGMGMDRRTVVLLFTAKGMILGLIGSGIGIALGQVFAYYSIIAVERTVSTVYHSISISDYFISGTDAAKAVVLGCFVSFLASFIPSLEAAKVRPNESSKSGSFESRYRKRQKAYSCIGGACIFLGVAASYVDYTYVPYNFPYLTYSGILIFILGVTLNAPAFLSLLLKVLKLPLDRIFRASGKITVSDIAGNRYRFSVALMSVAISSALIIALLSSIFSLKQSFRNWLDLYLVADVFIKPASCNSNYCYTPLPGELAKEISDMPEVKDIGRFRALETEFMGSKVITGFGDTAKWMAYRKKEHPDRIRIQSLGTGNLVSVSDYLKIRHRLKLGDEVEIQSPRGKTKFTVHHTSVSFSTTAGFLYMDRRWLRELWALDDETQLTIYLKEGRDTEQFIKKLSKIYLEKYSLSIVNTRELRQASLEVFDKSFALTYAIQLIAIIISLIGVVNTLLILVLEKKRDISILRYLGGGWDDIRNVMVLSAGIVGLAGLVLGGLMGPVISTAIIHAINKISFGWEVGLRIPWGYLAPLSIVLFLVTLAAGFIPSQVARKIDPKNFISFE